jgi:DNA end-binding protein Ku
MMPATSEGEKLRFHTLSRKTGNRVVSQYVDAVTGEAVDEDDEARGYERGENDFLILEDDELDRVALESARTIDISKFANREGIEWVWLEKPHYLTPSDQVGDEAFAVIRDAMAHEDVVGISRLVIGRRERAVMLEPSGKGMILWTLRYGDEVRKEEAYFEKIDDKADPALMPLIQALIKQNRQPWSPKMVHDPVQDRLLALIAEKKKALKPAGKPKRKAAEPPASGNVVSIMDTLRKSLAAEAKGKGAS